jgi:hydrogenase expression/formation protein HypC
LRPSADTTGLLFTPSPAIAFPPINYGGHHDQEVRARFRNAVGSLHRFRATGPPLRSGVLRARLQHKRSVLPQVRLDRRCAMCLGAPGQIVRFIEANVVECDFWGMTRQVRLDLLDGELAVGDYILDHEGYAVRRIDDALVNDTLALYEIILSEAGEDPIATEAMLGRRS